MTEAQHLWTQCSAMLRAQVSDATWRTWFEAVQPVALENGTLVLAVPSALAKERIEGRYLGLVRDLMSDATGNELPVRIDVHTEHRPQDDLSQLGIMANAGWQDPTVASAPTEPPKAPPVKESPVDPRYTFDAFVTGASNRFAHAAALSVAETPAKSYNPLFIHGNAGLGKTHLLHAIGNYVMENFPTRHVRYVSTETFMNEFVDAIRTNTTTSFKRRYRECDVLLVDDIQFMENKEGLQEEFFHTFNSLYGATKQIVITSDRPPRSIATLEDRLRSRFLSGLVTDVQPPELETRLAILREKAQGERASIPDEVLEFIATNVTDNIRELEGALIRVAAFASLNDQPVDQELAQRVLSDIIDAREPRRITPRLILESTATSFGFSVEELCGTSRRRPLVTARQIGMYVFRELTDFSYPAIAREFGGRDHTTVIHAVEKVSALMKERRQIYDQVTDLLHLVRSGG
ncbi:MAG TPA: chromosomal replication initiator protein DnaA [Acidimicrobiales bacterium]|nr:chromosomal replication initiator protein DnaA [Acidimicrobiales bacterium]